MGYRSDILAVFYTQDRDGDENRELNERNRAKLKLFVETNFPESLREEGADGFGDGLKVYETPFRLLYEFKNTSVKWYDSYPEVIAFDKFWEQFKELCDASGGDEPVLWSAEYIRLGENHDDIDEWSAGDADWLIRVSRTIETEY